MSKARDVGIVSVGVLLLLALWMRAGFGGKRSGDKSKPSEIVIENAACFVDGSSRDCSTLHELFVAGETVNLDGTHGQHGIVEDVVARLEARGVTVKLLDA